MQAGDMRGFVRLAREEARHPARLVGMGLFWAWLQVVFSSRALEPAPFTTLPFPALHQVWTLSLIVTACVFLVALAVKPEGFLGRPSVTVAGHALMACGTGCLAASAAWDGGPALIFAGILGVGAGSALAFLCWGLHLARLEPRRVLFDTAVFALLTALFYGVAVALPSSAEALFATAMPIVSGVLLVQTSRGDGCGSSAKVVSAPLRETHRGGGLLGLAVLVGLVYGVMRGASLSFGGGTVEGSTAATVLGIAATGVLLAVTTVFYRKESELYLVCEIAFPLMVGGYVLMPQFTGEGMSLPLLVFTIGHSYFYFMLWVFCSDQSRAPGRSTVRVFAAGLLAFLGSTLIGSLASDALALAGYEGGSMLGVLSLVVAYVFVLVFAFLFGRTRADRTRAESEADERRERLFEQCASAVAQDGGLTPREAEIFLLLARGLDRPAIRERLVISNDTVKTHTRRIYAKLDIHAKGEVRQLVQARVERELRGM